MRRLPKDEYFKLRMKQATEAGLKKKAAYYERRLKELTGSKSEPVPVEEMSREDLLRKSVKVWNAPQGTAQQKHAFLEEKGVPHEIILEALNIASNGALLEYL